MSKTLKRAFLSASALALTAGAAHAQFTLDILHINDLHSRIEAINAYDSTCSDEDEEAGECFGGVARIKTFIDERREALTDEGANLLVLDAGDQFQGSLFYTVYKGEAAAEFMNMIGFDAMAIGNHEFDDGPQGLADFIDMADVPVISGNTVADEGSVLDGAYEPYLIKDFDGEQVAILSVLATDTDETSSPGDTISFEDEIDYLNEAVAEVQAQNIDKIILLSHVGYVRDQEIAAAVDGIDLIVGGHSHTLLSNDDDGAAGPYPTMVANPSGTDVPIVQAYAYSKYVGELRVEFDEDGNVISATGEPHLLDASVEPDADVAARVDELAQPIEETMAEQVGEATGPIDGSRETCRQAECEMGNLVSDALLWRTQDQGTQIVFQNGGGLRASIDEGDITMGEVVAVLPFQNTLATFELSGANVVAALENGLSEYEEQAGRFAQVAGMRYSFDVTQPVGSRVVSVEVADGEGGFEPIDETATYLVASNNFMRGGGDGYTVFETDGMNAYDYGPGLEQVLADYLSENTPYEPYLDGRIVNVNADSADEAAEPAENVAQDAREAMEAEPEADTSSEMGENEGASEADPIEPAPAETVIPDEEDLPATEPADDVDAEAREAMEADPTADDGDASGMSQADPIEPAPAAETMNPETSAEADPIEPAPAEEAMDDGGEQTHTVAAGDTFWDLAARFYDDPTAWRMIADANPDQAARALEIGETLTIPAMR